jgi:hypothetical protein
MTLTRKTSLQRTQFKPTEAKPNTGPKPKKCQNKECRKPYMPDPKQPFKVWCSDDCGAAIALARLAKQKASKAKAERTADKRAKKEHKTTAQLAEPVRKLAQRYAVLRDRDYGCISCDKGPYWQGVWHGSHFKSVGSNSALQFNLLNINKACDQCNYFLAGNIGPYETRLRQKIGDEKVDWLKNYPRSREYSIDYLDRLAAILRKKIRRLEKKLGIK